MKSKLRYFQLQCKHNHSLTFINTQDYKRYIKHYKKCLLFCVNMHIMTHITTLLFPRSGVQNVQHIWRALLRFLCTYHAVAQTCLECAIWYRWVECCVFVHYQIGKYVFVEEHTRPMFHSLNLFSAGSVVQRDPTERLHLMSGLCSPVKAKNVVPHDIGDPGRKNKISCTTAQRGVKCNI